MRIRIPYWGHVKRYLPRTLFWRTFMIIIVPAMLLQIIICFIFLDRHWTAMGERLAAAVAGETSIILFEFEKSKTIMSSDELRSNLNNIASMTGMRILYQPHGKLSGKHGRIGRWLNTAPFVITELKKSINHEFIIAMHPRQDKWVRLQIDLKTDGLFIVEMPERRLFSATSYIFVLWILGSSFILFTIAMLFMRNQIRPIRRLSVAVERFGRGEDVPYFRPEGALEVRQAGASFLKMRERIRRQIEQRTTMLAGISHDLRTPVTRMKIEVEMLNDTQSAKGLKSDLNAMEQMLDGYLSFAKGEQDEKAEVVYLDQLLIRAIKDAKRQGCFVNSGELIKLKCRAKPVALYRALANIIANGCKYGNCVFIFLNKIKNDQGLDMAEIWIDDEGPGISKELRKDVFKPFFRIEKSRNPETGGVGLGLSIAQDIIHAHGGRLSLEEKPDGSQGLRVIILLPL